MYVKKRISGKLVVTMATVPYLLSQGLQEFGTPWSLRGAVRMQLYPYIIMYSAAYTGLEL